MTIKRGRQPPQPLDRQLALAEFKVADLLIGRPDLGGKRVEGDPAGLPQLFEPVRMSNGVQSGPPIGAE